MREKINFENVIHCMAIIAVTLMIVFSIINCDDNRIEPETLGINEIVIGNFSWHVSSDYDEGGKSTIKMEKVDLDKIAFEGDVEFINESVESEKHYGYACAEAEPNAAALDELKVTNYFTFKHKGDGQDYKVVVITSDVADGDYYFTTFTSNAAEKEQKVEYGNLEKMGNWSPIDPANIESIAFYATTDLEEGEFTFTIWDLKSGPSVVEQANILVLENFKTRSPISEALLKEANLIETLNNDEIDAYHEYLKNAYIQVMLSEGDNLEKLLSEYGAGFDLEEFIDGLESEENGNLENLTFEALLKIIDEWVIILAGTTADDYWTDYISSKIVAAAP